MERKNKGTKAISDNIKEEYCRQHPNAQECLCLLRKSSKQYQHGKTILSDVNDQYWYKPCQDEKISLIPSYMKEKGNIPLGASGSAVTTFSKSFSSPACSK